MANENEPSIHRNQDLVDMLRKYLDQAEAGEVSSGITVMFTPDGQYEIATSAGGNKFQEGGVLVAVGLQKMGFATQAMLPKLGTH